MGNYTPIILVVVVFVAFYFFSIRPQKKQEKEVEKQIEQQLEQGLEKAMQEILGGFCK